MDASNRQIVEATGKSGDTAVTVSGKVALIAGLKKIGCDELSSLEWVQTIKLALGHAKPHFKYIPRFLPMKQGKINRFNLSLIHQDKYEIGWLNQESFTLALKPGKPIDSAVLRLLGSAKVVEICEVCVQGGSGKILMDDHGSFFWAFCCRSKNHATGAETLTIDGADELPDDRLRLVVGNYPQIGPRVLFAIATMLKEDRDRRLALIAGESSASDAVEKMCANVDMFDNHYSEPFRWGFMNGSEKDGA